MGTVVRVPLAVDAQVRVPLGPVNLPIRGVFLVASTFPLDVVVFSVPGLPSTWRIGLAGLLAVIAFALAAPMREGIWAGTAFVYGYLEKYMQTALIDGIGHRATVRDIGGSVHITNAERGALSLPFLSSPKLRPVLGALSHYASVPRVSVTDLPGIFEIHPGGFRAVLRLTGPTVALNSDSYASWCNSVVDWLFGVDCPAQFLTLVTHYDSAKAEVAFDNRVAAWPSNPLKSMERTLAGQVADQSLGLQHYVIFAPGMCGQDGIPYLSKLTTANAMMEASEADADRVLRSAERIASGFGLDISKPDGEELAVLAANTVVGATSAATGSDMLRVGDQFASIVTVTKLPPRIEVGVVVEAIMRARTRGIASLHFSPVALTVARKQLNRQAALYKYAARQGNDDVDTQVALADMQDVLANMAQRNIKPCRIALTFALTHPEIQKVEDATERFIGLMNGHGFDVEQATLPGFLPALAVSPGCAPLGRSVLMTSDGVAGALVPALGTPFSDNRMPLVGISAQTGAPVYFSVWTQANHNVVILGSSGAGKSVATKTMLTRHVMEGVSAVVIDPDSEYKQVMIALGGHYVELGEDALNPLAAGLGVPPDTAASMILPILSVMGGDERGLKDGRPIRRLPDEDQGWLHTELAEFFRFWAGGEHGQEPVLHDLIEFIDTHSKARVLTEKEADRCRIITARLRRYTQGHRAMVFDRPSTFAVGQRPVGIGLKVFALSYGADLTPALAVVLTSILGALDRREGRMIVVVDEAHRVTSDPDAGEVLGQLVRQARKYGAGVWMCSQRVDDFVETDLGRTLAATAATKLLLGAEEAAVEKVADVFKLRPDEIAAISPMQQGRGVLLAGGERSVVYVVPGGAIMSLADTSAAVAQYRAAVAGDAA